MSEFYNKMKEIRKDADKSQKEIAEVLKITQQQYQLYETGKRYIPIDLLIEFCKYFKVPSDYILGLPDGLNWPRKEKRIQTQFRTKYNFLYNKMDRINLRRKTGLTACFLQVKKSNTVTAARVFHH